MDLKREDEPGKQPFAYMQIPRRRRCGTQHASIDQLVAVLQQARVAILAANSDLTMRGANAGFTSRRRTITTSGDNPHRLAALPSKAFRVGSLERTDPSEISLGRSKTPR